jgi:hypothetical protein
MDTYGLAPMRAQDFLRSLLVLGRSNSDPQNEASSGHEIVKTLGLVSPEKPRSKQEADRGGSESHEYSGNAGLTPAASRSKHEIRRGRASSSAEDAGDDRVNSRNIFAGDQGSPRRVLDVSQFLGRNVDGAKSLWHFIEIVEDVDIRPIKARNQEIIGGDIEGVAGMEDTCYLAHPLALKDMIRCVHRLSSFLPRVIQLIPFHFRLRVVQRRYLNFASLLSSSLKLSQG